MSFICSYENDGVWKMNIPLRKTNIKQHYVPQFYLKNFINDEQALFVFDIIRDKKYKNSTKNECFEKLFYDISPGFIKRFSTINEIHDEVVDDSIRIHNEQVSSKLFIHLNNMIKDKVILDFNEEELYNFVVLQMIRIPNYRQRIEHIITALVLREKFDNIKEEQYPRIVHNLLLYGVIERLYRLDFKLNQDYHHCFDCFIDEIINIRNELYKSGIVFLLNESKEKFITSTTPVNVRWKPNVLSICRGTITPSNKEHPVMYIGNNIEFLTIHFAISSNVSIFIFNKELGLEFNKMDRKIGLIEDWNSDLALNLNYSTFLKCLGKVFSGHDEFEKFVKMKNKKVNPLFVFDFNG